MEAGHSQEGSGIRVRSERELNCLGEWPPHQELERVSPKREPRELPEPQEVERVSPKREPRELPEPQEFEFVGVKQEPLEQPEDDEFLPQEPECVLEQKDEGRGVAARTRELRRTQEPEYIAVQKEEGCGGGEQRALIQVHENGVVQDPAAIGAGAGTGAGCAREEEEILGLVAEVPWVAPCVPAAADPLTSAGDAVTDSKNGEFYTLGWGHTSGDTRRVSPGEVDHYRPAAAAASSGRPPCDSFAARSCRSAGPEPTRRAFRCDSCSVIFSSKYHLVNHVFTHIAEVPPPSHVCRWCAEVFSDTASLLEHSKGHESRPEAPAVLSKPSRAAGRGKKRRRVRKPHETKPHVCNLCGKAFPSLGNLNLHARTHSGERRYACDVCGKSFVQSVHLQNHRLTHTAEKRHYCEFCGRAFSLLNTLKVHLRMHTGEKPYSCGACGAAFHLLGTLRTHQQTHTGRKPFECDECGKFFAAPNSLRRHKRMHSGEKPYGCELCGEAFMWSASLQKHRQLHTGGKPFQCDLCSSAFAEMGGLNRHMRIHTRERPYACDVCGASFATSNNLKRHRRKQHVETCVAVDV